MNIVWDADKYAESFGFVPQYGVDMFSLIDFSSVRTALDVGCGNGALTHRLSEAGLKVTGLDQSPQLLARARSANPDLPFMEADATDFTLDEPVDLVFSNAVFHWIGKERQPDLLRCISCALKPGGQFVFEFGGAGNNQKIHSALATVFEMHGFSYEIPFYFPSIGEYAALLEKAGFVVRAAWLFDRPTPLQGERGMQDWIEMFVKRPFEAVQSEEERRRIVEEAMERLKPELYRDGAWSADYVRLRMKAEKPL